MREILFRGKCKDNGKWIEGSLVSFFKYKSAAILASKTTAYLPKGSTTFCTNSCYEVIPETVGEFTGLTDKDGKKIFEGDIVKNEILTFVVAWSEELAAFVLANHSKGVYVELYKWVKTDLKIIGNLHDNPELLKGGAGK